MEIEYAFGVSLICVDILEIKKVDLQNLILGILVISLLEGKITTFDTFSVTPFEILSPGSAKVQKYMVNLMR